MKGQRDPKLRISEIAKHISLEGRAILDLGCSTGGMLFHLPSPPRVAIGWDFDDKAIRFNRKMLEYISKTAPEFASRYQFERVNLDGPIERKLETVIKSHQIDLIFLLSIGSWVASWETIYLIAAKSGASIILETNNDEEGLAQLELFSKIGLDVEEIVASSEDDATKNLGRRTYLVQKVSSGQ